MSSTSLNLFQFAIVALLCLSISLSVYFFLSLSLSTSFYLSYSFPPLPLCAKVFSIYLISIYLPIYLPANNSNFSLMCQHTHSLSLLSLSYLSFLSLFHLHTHTCTHTHTLSTRLSTDSAVPVLNKNQKSKTSKTSKMSKMSGPSFFSFSKTAFCYFFIRIFFNFNTTTGSFIYYKTVNFK